MTTIPKKILVTGAAGFIGSQLAYGLHSDGYDVILLDDMSFGYEDNLVVDGRPFGRFVKGDVRDAGTHALYTGVDTVFHFAGISALPVNQENPYYAIDVNVAGTAQVLEGARRAGVRRVVFASTSATYENNDKFPSEEADPVSPDLVYATSKFQAEQLCHAFGKAYGMEIAIVRYYNVYGPHQDFKRKSPPLTSYVVRELVMGRQPVLHSSGEQKRDYVHVADVNRLNRLCMDHPNAPGQIFNAASGSQISVNEIYAVLARALDSDLKPVFRAASHFWDQYPSIFEGPYPLSKARVVKEVEKYTLGSCEKASRLLGWQPQVDIQSGLSQMVRYIQEHLPTA